MILLRNRENFICLSDIFRWKASCIVAKARSRGRADPLTCFLYFHAYKAFSQVSPTPLNIELNEQKFLFCNRPAPGMGPDRILPATSPASVDLDGVVQLRLVTLINNITLRLDLRKINFIVWYTSCTYCLKCYCDHTWPISHDHQCGNDVNLKQF